MNTTYPFISVILPIRNEENTITSVLDSLLAQDYNFDKIEMIICDGDSDDRTVQIVKKFSDQDSRIKIINNINKIVSCGFNLGLNEAKGDIIIRIDGHVEISSNYISRCVELLETKNVDIVGGCIVTKSIGNVGKSIAIAQSSFFGVGGVKFRSKKCNISTYVNTLAFGAHKREIFSDIGGYDQDMVCNQDDEFNYRAIQYGKKIWMDHSIKTIYYSRSNYSQLFKQYFNYGFFKVRGFQKRKKIFSIRHLIPSTFIITLIVNLLLGTYLQQMWVFCSVFFPYLFINVVSSIISSPKVIHFPLIFISFCILHFGYGLGFIWGMFWFMNKWKDNELKDDCFIKKKIY